MTPRSRTRVGKRVLRPSRILAAAVATALIVSTLAACGSSSTASSSKQVLRIGITAGASNLDPAKDTGSNAFNSVRALTNESLIHISPDGKLVPGLALSWRYIGNGNKEFELTLRQNAKFSDGTPVDAAAVAAWLRYFPKANGPAAYKISIASVTTAGQWTVQIHLADPNPTMPYILSEAFNWGFVSSAKATAQSSLMSTNTYGAGPYVLDSSASVANDHYTFVPNKYYYDKSQIKFTRVIAKVISNPTAMIAALQSGQLDVAQGDASTASSATSAGFNVESGQVGTDGLIFLDRAGKLSPPLADVSVRQALNYAVNRTAITKALLGEYGVPTSEIGSVDGYDPAYLNYYAYDPNKAKQLLASAGYPHGFTVKVIDSGNFAGKLGDPMTQAVAEDLSKVGVQLQITTASSSTDYATKLLNGSFPVGQQAHGNSPMYQFYIGALKGSSVLNPHGAADPAMDQLFDQAMSASDPGPYWKQMSQRTVTQADWLPVLDYKALWFVSKNVSGVGLNTLSAGIAYASDWSLR